MTNQKRTSSCVKYFVLLILPVISADEHYFKTRSDATFGPKTNGKPESILWKLQGNKVVEYENGQPQWYRFQGNANLNAANGSLTLKNVNGDFNGTYECEIEVTGKLTTTIHTIFVIDAVTKPKVTCQINGSEIQLHCSMDPPLKATFTWSGPDNYGSTGSNIRLQKQLDNDKIRSELYICTAENQVSNDNTDFKLEDCIPPEPPGPNVGVIVGVTIVIILVVILAALAFMFWKKKKDCDEQKNGNSHEIQNLK